VFQFAEPTDMSRPILPEGLTDTDLRMVAVRLPADVRDMLKEMSDASGLSQAKVISNVMRWAYPHWQKQVRPAQKKAKR